jgi:hypothetical protein
MGVPPCSEEGRDKLKKQLLSEENEKLKKALKIAIEVDPTLITHLEKCNLGLDLSKYKENISQLIKNPKQEINAINFYDVIVSIQSIKGIIEGWNIKINERINVKYNEIIKDRALKIGVIGNSNKGKSFILSKISKILLPSGTSIKTEGLSIKYPDLKEFPNRRIILLDSAGLETPVLKDNNENKINDEKREKEQIKLGPRNLNSNEIKKENDSIQTSNTENEEKDENKIIKEISRDKVITEYFLQNYIMHNSDILIVIVGLLTYSEQTTLNRIKNELNRAKLNKSIYVIHNLMTYTTKKQVEDYIDDILLKSATFNLEKQLKINTKTDNESEKGVCFYEKKSIPPIFHLIFANDGSEAGNYYNEYTLKFLENKYEAITDLKYFDILETIKERFKEVSKEIIQNLEGEISFEKS